METRATIIGHAQRRKSNCRDRVRHYNGCKAVDILLAGGTNCVVAYKVVNLLVMI